ncbi:twin-arginine translocase subunit TatC [Halodesulfurarchaeum sp. HSR-GB]|uniref:twin-arginine translocase subunit TatC n=1 Tax=Halodesulfurarchaeum sp. HSR-GB TaxID=3074077 RepID=UPI0028651A5F|nr:twin-arginine translocase subunit TatC [Halodesulfurarchaeum sp. HSR-GB]MDR5656231.1 twin-arginine translocase subunit TatC [Halodesulfurarchaeum sp. HSR-GB]
MSRDPSEGSDGEPTDADEQRADRQDSEDSRTEIVDLDAEDNAEPNETDAFDATGGTDDESEAAETEDESDDSGEAETHADGSTTEPAEGADEAEETTDEPEDTDEAEETKDETADTGEEAEDTDEAEETTDEPEDTDEESDTETPESETETTPIERKTGPAEDQEQPLTEHIEEMVKRVAVVVVIAGVVSLLAFPYGEEFINFLWYSVLPSDISKPHVYHPLELVVTQLKAASLLGLVLALPVFVYETYAFMRPGLYPHERRYYLAAVPTSLVLAFVGLLFGYFLILPAVMTYFLQYSRDVVDIAFALGQTFSLMLVLLGFLAVVFQIPLFVMLAIMMGLTTRTWLEERRLIIWGVFLAIAFLFSPDPTGMAPFLVAVTMIGLFEGTLLLLRWTGRGNG